MPFIEKLKEITEKNYHVPGNSASGGDLDFEEIGWGRGGVNDETDDVLVIDGEGGDEDDDANENDDAIDYIHSDDAVASKMAVDEQ